MQQFKNQWLKDDSKYLKFKFIKTLPDMRMSEYEKSLNKSE